MRMILKMYIFELGPGIRNNFGRGRRRRNKQTPIDRRACDTHESHACEAIANTYFLLPQFHQKQITIFAREPLLLLDTFVAASPHLR